MIRLGFRELIGLKVLIVGDVGSGKTKLTSDLLEEAVETGFSKKITAIDMAPEFKGVGGKISRFTDRVGEVRYLVADVRAPRLEGRDRDEVLSIAKRNARSIEPLLLSFIRRPTEILFVNDVTLYLHSGRLEYISRLVKSARTFIANGYKGGKLLDDKGSGLSIKERLSLEWLEGLMDKVVKL